ncbi:MAG: FlgB family protein [Pseudomonadota bacterium]
MLEGTEIVRVAQELARHSGTRQAEIARNVANADTPGYRARDVVPFAELYAEQTTLQARKTRDDHLSGAADAGISARVVDSGTEASPNGNSVSLETEIMKAADVQKDHGLALAVYQSSLDLMRTAVGRGR